MVAGASGALGRHVLRELKSRGYRTRALVRDPDRLGDDAAHADETVVADLVDADDDDLRRACAGTQAVISVAGASTRMSRTGERRSFLETDRHGNQRLLAAAVASGVERFLYVSIFNAHRLRHVAYVKAHEDVVEALRASPLHGVVVRANGFFSSYDEMLDVARKGRFALLSSGEQRSNPVHEADLAAACVTALEGDEGEIEVGGPEVHTRREEIELAYAALGREAKTFRLPGPLLKAGLLALRLLDRRRQEVLEFLVAINRMDMVAPTVGRHRLGEYLRDRAA